MAKVRRSQASGLFIGFRIDEKDRSLIEEAVADVHPDLAVGAWVRALAVQAARESRARRQAKNQQDPKAA